jgi:hypothetical protein
MGYGLWAMPNNMKPPDCVGGFQGSGAAHSQ